MNKFEELKAKLASLEEHAFEFYTKSNKSRGVILRKAFQDIKSLAQEARQEVSEKTKAIPVAKREKKA